MTAGAVSAVIIGLSNSIDRQEARDLLEVRSGWNLVAALASGRMMSEEVDKADLLIFEDTMEDAELVMQAVAALSTPPTLAILSERSPVVVAGELGCSSHDVVTLSPGVSLIAAMLRVLAAFEAKGASEPRIAPPVSPRQPMLRRPAPMQPTPARRHGDTPSSGPVTSKPNSPASNRQPRRNLLVIGASTGGPDALGVLLAGLPRDFPAPILITQHMPRTFTELLAATLERATSFTVREAKHGDVATPGYVYVAPGGSHMVVTDRHGTIALTEDPPEHNCRPSVDVLFRSAAATFGRSCVAVVLTGMGSDGAIGAAGLGDLGAHVIAQDRETSVVWGMPGAVAQRGAADQILPLKEIAPAIGLQFERTAPSSMVDAGIAPNPFARSTTP